MGFIGHFYGVSEHTSPVLAWGFLGPDSHLKDLCNFFKVHVSYKLIMSSVIVVKTLYST